MPIEQFLSPTTIMLIGVIDSLRTLLLIVLIFFMVTLLVDRRSVEMVSLSLKMIVAIFILYLLIPTKGTIISCLVLKTYPPHSWILPEIVAQLLGVL